MLNHFFKKIYFRGAQRELAKLQKILFANYFSPEKNDKAVHRQRLRVLKTIEKNSWCAEQLNEVADIIFSVNQLRHRVKDFSIFEVCARELEGIEKTSIAFIQDAENFSGLFAEKIHQFEAMYNATLRVVAPDPLVFLFFIQDLYALQEKVNQLSNEKPS